MAKSYWKNYALAGGADNASNIGSEAFEHMVEQDWFACKIERKTLKQITKRSDAVPLRHFALWLGLLVVSGVAGLLTWGTWWCILPFAVYGILYSAADHRGHELSHGTPFKTRWLNTAFFHLCSFMTLREAYYYRWSHSRHHTHTIIVGRDPEIGAPRPTEVLGPLLDLFFLKDGFVQLSRIAKNATGTLTTDGQHFVPEMERRKVVWLSRLYLVIILATIVACLAAHSILPAMFIVLPRFYGGALSQLFNFTQHAGLDEDVYDHRLNTRTVIMNRVFSFLYINMNYHIEHHMFPMVPFYALPQLHELIRDQSPTPIIGLWGAYREIIPAIIRLRRDPKAFIVRQIPAKPTDAHLGRMVGAAD